MMRLIHGGVLLCLLAWAPAARALCVLCSCTTSTTPVAFGAYNPIGGTPSSGNGNVRLSCTGTVGLFVDYSVSLGKGQNGATYADRKMAAGTGRLAYQLYGDSPSGGACSVVWGDGTEGSSTVGGSLLIVLLGSNQNMQVCGTVPASQTSAKPGSYSDTIQVTVTYN